MSLNAMFCLTKSPEPKDNQCPHRRSFTQPNVRPFSACALRFGQNWVELITCWASFIPMFLFCCSCRICHSQDFASAAGLLLPNLTVFVRNNLPASANMAELLRFHVGMNQN